MHEIQPLMALLSQAESERDTAQAHRQRMQEGVTAAQIQAEQLLVYRREYEQRWGERFASQGQMELVHAYHGFVVRLNQAVDHQGRVAEQAQRQLDRAGETLMQQEMRVASVRKLIERRLHEIEQRSALREQRQLDELASRAAWNRLAAATTRY